MRRGDAAPPVATLDELKAFLRIEHAEEDALLHGLLRTASAVAEAFLGEMLVERDVVEEGPAAEGRLPVSARPVRSVTQVERREGSSWITLEAGAWRLETDRLGRTVVAADPGGTHLRVRLRAGSASDWTEVPEPVRFAVVRAAAHAYAHRDATAETGWPALVAELLAPYRRIRI